jgi:hypothetical protein
MELFDLLVRIGRLQLHFGIAMAPREGSQQEGPDREAGPMPRLEPVDAPLPVVFDEEMDPALLRERLGFK